MASFHFAGCYELLCKVVQVTVCHMSLAGNSIHANILGNKDRFQRINRLTLVENVNKNSKYLNT
jgi:hypothetical protein